MPMVMGPYDCKKEHQFTVAENTGFGQIAYQITLDPETHGLTKL